MASSAKDIGFVLLARTVVGVRVKSGRVQMNRLAKLVEIGGAFNATELFLRIELVVYVALGILLSATALLALGSAALLLVEAMRDWNAPALYSLSSIG
jgi:hypothetical protein